MSKIIIRFRYENLRNESHVEFHENFERLVNSYTAAALGIAALYDVYTPLFVEERSVLDLIRRSELTDELDAKDGVRDHVFRGLADAVKSSLNHFNGVKRTAAEKLEVVFEHYGNIARKTYDDETAAIDDLYRELHTAPHADEIAALALGEWVEQLYEENRKFADLMAARYSEAAQRPTLRMKNVRTEVDQVFRSILDLLEALVQVNGADTNASFIKELNVVMERYKNILAQEAGRRAKKVKSEEV